MEEQQAALPSAVVFPVVSSSSSYQLLTGIFVVVPCLRPSSCDYDVECVFLTESQLNLQGTRIGINIADCGRWFSLV